MSKYYQGYYQNGYLATRAIVNVTDDYGTRKLSVLPSLRLADHSPTGFEWGYNGSGPLQLSLAMILDSTFDEAFALANYAEFAQEIIGLLPHVWGLWLPALAAGQPFTAWMGGCHYPVCLGVPDAAGQI